MDSETKAAAAWRLPAWVGRAGELTARALRLAAVGLKAFWQVARPLLRTALLVLLALLILLEEWGWRPLSEILGRLARWRPWAQLETAIARLPPYAALLVFALPSALLLPLKFLALFLIAKGQLVLAALLFAAAKVAATAVVARLFLLTQPALMQIGWFAWAYDRFMPWKEALVEHVRASTVWRVGGSGRSASGGLPRRSGGSCVRRCFACVISGVPPPRASPPKSAASPRRSAPAEPHRGRVQSCGPGLHRLAAQRPAASATSAVPSPWRGPGGRRGCRTAAP